MERPKPNIDGVTMSRPPNPQEREEMRARGQLVHDEAVNCKDIVMSEKTFKRPGARLTFTGKCRTILQDVATMEAALGHDGHAAEAALLNAETGLLKLRDIIQAFRDRYDV